MNFDIRFDTYYNYEDLNSKLYALIEAYPQLLKIESIGKSYQGRDVWCVTATNFNVKPDNEKPAYWCDGNIHATEVSASSACLYLIHKLAVEYGHNPLVTRAMDTRAFYIVPRVNPDGAELYFADKPRYLRSSARPYPYDEEPVEGLRMEDVDGDGRILSMRIKDQNGPWKLLPEHPRIMVRRDPIETEGAYYRLLPEGMLENWDGITLTIKQNKEKLDMNRNFPSQWRQECDQFGAGPFPGSEPEVQNLLQFITSHPNITGGIAFHTFGGALLRPYSAMPDDKMPAEDLWAYQTIGKKGEEITGYPAISVHHDFRYHPNEVITGAWDDWMYEHLGLYAWTVEIWSPQRQAGITDGFAVGTKSGEYRFIQWGREHSLEEDIKMLEWSDSNLSGQGYVSWQEFQHPQLGSVEIGGWDVQEAFRNPPGKALEKEIAPLADWAIWNTLVSPLLELSTSAAQAIGEGAWRICVVVDNTGWLPTYITKKAIEKKTVRGVIAEIEIPEGAELITGKLREDIGQLEGRAYKASSASGWTTDSTNERAKVEWVVTGTPGMVVNVTLKHERAGHIHTKLTLE